MSEVELTIVTMQFDASDPDALQSVLAKYTVLTRMDPACRNIDLCASVTSPGRFVIVQKWDSPTSQQAHFDSDVMVDMATACRGLLAKPPAIDLLESISAHDLR
jgi:quinol monooxygenase YgiN